MAGAERRPNQVSPATRPRCCWAGGSSGWHPGTARFQPAPAATDRSTGIWVPIPRIAGQHADYAVAQLLAFRDGVRLNNAQMTGVTAQDERPRDQRPYQITSLVCAERSVSSLRNPVRLTGFFNHFGAGLDEVAAPESGFCKNGSRGDVSSSETEELPMIIQSSDTGFVHPTSSEITPKAVYGNVAIGCA